MIVRSLCLRERRNAELDKLNKILHVLVQVCCWCIGEYGSSLLDGSTPQVTEVNDDGKPQTASVPVTEDEVVEVYQQILWANHISVVTKQVMYVG